MGYVLEKITDEIRPSIIEHLTFKQKFFGMEDFFQLRFLDRAYFWESERYRAIDPEKGFYVMEAPYMSPMSGKNWYYFCFKSRIYCFTKKDSLLNHLIDLYDRQPNADEFEEFKKELTEAYKVYISQFRSLPIQLEFPVLGEKK